MKPDQGDRLDPPAPEAPPPADAAVPASPQPEERGTLQRGFAFGGLSIAAEALVGVVATFAVARLFGIETVGAFALANAPAGIVSLVSTLGERPSLIRLLAVEPPRAPRVTALFATIFAFSAALSVGVSLLALIPTYLLLNGPIGQPALFAPSVVIVASYALIVNSCWMLDAVFGAFRDGSGLFAVRIHQSVAYLGLAVLAGLVSPTLTGLIVALIASWASALVHRLLTVGRWMRLRVSPGLIRETAGELGPAIRFGIKLTPGGIADGVSAQASTWILGLTSTIAAVGAWNRVWRLGYRFLALNFRFAEMLFPTLVERHHQNDDRGFERALGDAVRYAGVTLMIPAAAATGVSGAIVGLLGPGFGQAATALSLVLFVPSISAVATLQTQALIARGMPTLSSAASLVKMVVTIAASVPLCASFGATGAAIGVLVGVLVHVTMQVLLLKRRLGISSALFLPRRYWVLVPVAAGAGAFVSKLSAGALPDLLGLLAGPALGIATGCLAFVAGGGLLARDHQRIRGMLDRSPRVRMAYLVIFG